jgi:uncharacterized protein
MDKLGRLMSLDLPQFIDPLRFAKAGRQLAGQFEIKAMGRLGALLFADNGKIFFKLEFGRDKGNEVFFITGQIESDLIIVCQRCLEGLELHINSSLKLGIVSSKNEAELLPSEYEPLLLMDNSVSLLELVEDEILLALPIAASHDIEKCSVTNQLEEHLIIEKNKLFVELEKLKKKIRN